MKNISCNLTLITQESNIDEKVSTAKAKELLRYFDIAEKEKAMPSRSREVKTNASPLPERL